MEIQYVLLGGVLVWVLGGVFFFVFFNRAKRKRTQMLNRASKEAAYKINEAERVKQSKINQAKERFDKLKFAHDRNVRESKKELNQQKRFLHQKQVMLSMELNQVKQKMTNYRTKEQALDKVIASHEAGKVELSELKEKYIKQLEEIGQLSQEQVRQEMEEVLSEPVRKEVDAYAHRLVEEAKLNASDRAKKLLIDVMQRIDFEKTVENCIYIMHLERDELKGKIIGKEGRNIRTLEQATGAEVIIDETPSTIVISCFDPVRRQIAYKSVESLLKVGRIHPAKIEEIVKKEEAAIEQEIIDEGKRVVSDLRINGLHPELIRMIGRMKFRTESAQNLLQHSKEVANLCGMVAAELELDVKIAKKAGLLHDIGKVCDIESEQSHALMGMELAKKCGEKIVTCNAIGAHHDEIPMENLYAPIVQVCNMISAERPGARKPSLDAHIKRQKSLEELAMSFEGVQKAYAVQAGRELRVIVKSDLISDEGADCLAFDISQKIQKDRNFPEQVSVVVIRERRSVMTTQ